MISAPLRHIPVQEPDGIHVSDETKVQEVVSFLPFSFVFFTHQIQMVGV